MGTKNDPAPFDCYANAEPDEPMFVLLARDGVAPATVRQWVFFRMMSVSWDATLRAESQESFVRMIRGLVDAQPEEERAQLLEALECADAMDEWRKVNRT